ncbi:hypothetical protein GF312_08955 [Candidatus Poribacteria bacterium]|nr:hypothetical protein [Candidatus Poribacteria bacterium]
MKIGVAAPLALLLVLISSLSYARDVPIYPALSQQNVNVGDEISVKINVDQVSDLKGIDILVSYDNLKLEYLSIDKSMLIDNFVEDILPDPELSKTTGKLEYVAALGDRGPGIDSPGGTIFTINFLAKSPGEAWIKLDPNDVSLGDSIANNIPAVIDNDRHIIQIGQVFRIRRVFNYPNPAPDSEGNTVIRVETMAILEDMEARIYDISGEIVTSAEFDDFDTSNAPVYEYTWNCKNEADQEVANGTYILWIKAKLGSEEKHETWKIAVLR